MSSVAFNSRLNPRNGKRERKTVSSTAVGLTESAYAFAATGDSPTQMGTLPKNPSGAVLQVFTDSIYYTLDGSTPSATVGFEAALGDTIYLDSFQQIKEFKAIRKTTDAAVEALYYYGA